MRERIKFRLRLYLAVFTVLLLVGILGFRVVEHMSLTDAIYFSIVTMATVGYGDIHPQTEIGKILTLVIIVGGVGTFLGIIANITELFVSRREEAIRHQKIDMVRGLFFSEMGNELLKQLTRFDPGVEALHPILAVSPEWKNDDFESAENALKKHALSIDSHQGDLSHLLGCLQERRELLLRLIENPFIQEHEAFTELLRALFHLRDELLNRTNLSDLLESDRKHIEGDVARVYERIMFQWLRYMRHLKGNYGYLFSLAVRTNPFDPKAPVVVKDG